MKFLLQWLPKKWRYDRDAERLTDLYSMVFSTKPGHDLLEFWLETIVLNNPRSLDPYEAIAWQARCAFIEDIIRALDRAENTEKYKTSIKSSPLEMMQNLQGGGNGLAG